MPINCFIMVTTDFYKLHAALCSQSAVAKRIIAFMYVAM